MTGCEHDGALFNLFILWTLIPVLERKYFGTTEKPVSIGPSLVMEKPTDFRKYSKHIKDYRLVVKSADKTYFVLMKIRN